MNLRELIESEGLRDEPDYEEIARHLNKRPLIPNPNPRGDVPDPPTMGQLQGLIASMPTAQQDLGVIGKIAALIRDGKAVAEYTGLSNEDLPESLLPMMAAYGLSPDTLQAIKTRLAQTMPDPDWQGEIEGPSLAEQNGLGIVRPEQVQEAFSGWAS